jgi:DNA-binding transcriptional regulator WhiA
MPTLLPESVTASVPPTSGVKVKASKEMCEKLKTQWDQYKNIRKEHPDVDIRNLNETLEKMEEYYTTYGCDTY